MRPFQRPFQRPEGRPLTSSGAIQPVGQVLPGAVQQSSQQRGPLQLSPTDIKRKIQHQLEREKFEKYWKLLSQFICGEVNKIDFDVYIRSNLSEPQRKLHNLFLLTLLRSAYTSLNAVPLNRQDTRIQQYIPTLCVGPKDIQLQPPWQRLQATMEWKASTMGMDAVDNGAVNVLLIALEQHIKSIMSHAAPSRRHFQRVPIPPIEQHLAQLKHQEVLNYNRPGIVQIEDLSNSMNIVPNALSRKRISLWDANQNDLWNFHYTTQHQSFYSPHTNHDGMDLQDTQEEPEQVGRNKHEIENNRQIKKRKLEDTELSVKMSARDLLLPPTED